MAQPLPARQIQILQCRYGNQYVAMVAAQAKQTQHHDIQAKLVVGPTDDPFEREAIPLPPEWYSALRCKQCWHRPRILKMSSWCFERRWFMAV